VLIAQPPLLQTLALVQNEEIRSRVTYSVIMPRLGPELIEAFICYQPQWRRRKCRVWAEVKSHLRASLRRERGEKRRQRRPSFSFPLF